MSQELNLGSGNNVGVKASKLVSLHETLVVFNGGKSVELDVKIEADFDTIPETYHEIFLNILTSKYYNKASFGDNPFSQCVPVSKKRWWQFWK